VVNRLSERSFSQVTRAFVIPLRDWVTRTARRDAEVDLMEARPALHPTDQTLHVYGLGRLDDASAESVNQHLEDCPDCRQRVAGLSADRFLGRPPDDRDRPESP
jgi:hypothetical protein